MHNKNCCVESQLLSGQMHRECCYYCEVSMNNIKALPGCFCGSHQLGQTLGNNDGNESLLFHILPALIIGEGGL